jgi:DASH complex subunit ASK1
MSRPAASRGLTLTEELERLEQQITLTLQEIDSNFSKAHRIVTSSILPIVEQYGKHSNDVWESSKFWKQFFEASANVSLSGYEEGALDDQDATNTELDTTATALETPETERRAVAGHQSEEEDDDSYTVESPTQMTGVHSTPKLPPSTGKGRSSQHKSSFGKSANSTYHSPSPRKYTGRNARALSQSSEEPSTPNAPATRTHDLFSSPFETESAARPSAQESNPDAVLHRNVLDKNYRIQATPHSQRKQQSYYNKSAATTPGTATRTQRQPWDDSPGSSPEISAPQLRSDLFSPAPALKPRPQQQQQYIPQPLTPGISVLTPAKPSNNQPARMTSTGRPLSSPPSARNRASRLFAAESSDEDDSFVMSPPKTMQFHVPQSRLLQTPAREASRKIVDDLLLTAGADATDEIEGEDGYFEEPSPSVVRKSWDEDDTF